MSISAVAPDPARLILLVDDDATLRLVLERAFTRRGLQVLSAATATAALELARAHQPAQALVDLKIDQDSGLQLIPKLLACSPATAIVMLTGYSSIATAVEAIKLGAINYLCKPVDADEILQAFNQRNGDPDTAPATDPHSVNRLEWEHIQKVLTEFDGNISATARALGMHRRTLQRKLQKRPVKH